MRRKEAREGRSEGSQRHSKHKQEWKGNIKKRCLAELQLVLCAGIPFWVLLKPEDQVEEREVVRPSE